MLPVEIATKLRNFLSITFRSVVLCATTGMAVRIAKWLEDAVALLGASGNSSAAEIAEDTSNVSKMQLIDFICISPLSHSQPEVCYPMTGSATAVVGTALHTSEITSAIREAQLARSNTGW